MSSRAASFPHKTPELPQLQSLAVTVTPWGPQNAPHIARRFVQGIFLRNSLAGIALALDLLTAFAYPYAREEDSVVSACAGGSVYAKPAVTGGLVQSSALSGC